MSTPTKPYVCTCALCQQELQSISLSGILTVIRRHRKKIHASYHGSIPFHFTMTNGQRIRWTGESNEG